MGHKLPLDDYFQAVLQIVRQAGTVIENVFTDNERIMTSTKNSYADLVTDTDHQIEEMIIHYLRNRYPTHRFIGEEMSAGGSSQSLSDEPTWVIDPLDGTTNFVHRFPHVAISVALLINKQVVIGVVYNPIMDQMYTARTGWGAFCNSNQLHVSATTQLSEALLCLEFGSSRDPAVLDAKFRCIRNIVNQAKGIRTVGSAALHMCMVAAGELDAHFTYGVHIWDIAAGDLIVREAGGVVIDTSGGPCDLQSRQVICAASKSLAQQIASSIEHIDMQRD